MSKTISSETVEMVETLREENAVLRGHVELLQTTRDRVMRERDDAQAMLDQVFTVLRSESRGGK